MKKPDPASITATFVSAILSLILPASAMSAAEPLRHIEPVPAHEPSKDERARMEPFHDDPILESSKWGPGDPNLAVAKFQFRFRDPPKDAGVTRAPPSPR